VKKRKLIYIVTIFLIASVILFYFAFENLFKIFFTPDIVKNIAEFEKNNNGSGDIVKTESGSSKNKTVSENKGSRATSKNQKTSENPGNVKEEVKTGSELQNDIRDLEKAAGNVSVMDKLEVSKIVLSALTKEEIEELIKLYREGKSTEAISKAKYLLKSRLNKEQIEKLKEIYNKYF